MKIFAAIGLAVGDDDIVADRQRRLVGLGEGVAERLARSPWMSFRARSTSRAIA